MTPAAKPTKLQKVDYLEYVEQTGESVIELLIRHNSKISGMTSKLRNSISKTMDKFGNLDNDSWRIVNYVSP